MVLLSIVTSTAKEPSTKSNPILIIEDSLAIIMSIKEFLNALGYYEIKSATTGKEGMQLFENLVKSNTLPIVFLDYNLPDVDADIVLPHILKIRPHAKVIVTTALEKGEQAVKDVIMRGAYLYLQKPVRFNNIQNAIQILEDERDATKKENAKVEQQIDSVLKPTFVTLPRIAELCNISREKGLAYLKELESSGKVLCSNNVEEISCNSCGSVMIEKDSDSETTADHYHCLRCNNRFETSKAKKMTTQAFRIKAQYNLKTPRHEEEY